MLKGALAIKENIPQHCCVTLKLPGYAFVSRIDCPRRPGQLRDAENYSDLTAFFRYEVFQPAARFGNRAMQPEYRPADSSNAAPGFKTGRNMCLSARVYDIWYEDFTDRLHIGFSVYEAPKLVARSTERMLFLLESFFQFERTAYEQEQRFIMSQEVDPENPVKPDRYADWRHKVYGEFSEIFLNNFLHDEKALEIHDASFQDYD